MSSCKSINCNNTAPENHDFCEACDEVIAVSGVVGHTESLSQRYPQYYKDVTGFDEIDVYAVHSLFNIIDPAGCIQHASKKLLLSGVRTGNKSAFKDIREARDTLSRWLQLNPESHKA